jgi:magnesium chelatase family protein
MFINVPRLPTSVLLKSTTFSNIDTKSAKTQITTALSTQAQRFGQDSFFNAHLNSVETSKLITLPDTKQALDRATKNLQLSARAYFRLIRVARTIADLNGSEVIKRPHIAAAAQYRSLDRKYWSEG